MSKKLPLEELREKYIPVSDFPEKYNISVATIKRLISSGQIRQAEFRALGATRRTTHVNPEDVLRVLNKE